MFFNDIDLNDSYELSDLSGTFHKLWVEDELPDYEELYSPNVIEYTDELEAELYRAWMFFALDDNFEPPVTEGEYADLRKGRGKEVARLAAAIRPANAWTDVEDECDEIIKLQGICVQGILEKELEDSLTDIETVMRHAGKMFGVDIY